MKTIGKVLAILLAVLLLTAGGFWFYCRVINHRSFMAGFTDLFLTVQHRSGIDVTINSDDVLIFDSDVSKEYLRLYQCGCLDAKELDDIRKNGLRRV